MARACEADASVIAERRWMWSQRGGDAGRAGRAVTRPAPQKPVRHAGLEDVHLGASRRHRTLKAESGRRRIESGSPRPPASGTTAHDRAVLRCNLGEVTRLQLGAGAVPPFPTYL